MTRSELIEINTTLCDTVDDIEDILNLLEQTDQSTLNIDALARKNRHYEQALTAVRDLASGALAEIADGDDA